MIKVVPTSGSWLFGHFPTCSRNCKGLHPNRCWLGDRWEGLEEYLWILLLFPQFSCFLVVRQTEDNGALVNWIRLLHHDTRDEDFTLSHRFHVDSRWTPGGFLESRWTFDLFFLDVSPANSLSRIHLESIWSPPGVHLESTWSPLVHMDSTSDYREIWILQARLHMDSTWINYILLYYIIIKKMHKQELNTQPSEWWLI